jgi:hypothetical protein
MHGDRRDGGNGAAILLAALIVGAAILIGPCNDGRATPPVADASVRRQVVDQLTAQLQPRPPAAGESALKRVQVTEVRFSRTFDRLLVEFEVTWEPSMTVRGTALLADDGFGRYRGEWNDGRFRVPLAVKS